MSCPDCGNRIPLDFRKLFFGSTATCSGCGIVLSVNMEESHEAIEAIKKVQDQMSKTPGGQVKPLE
jgi:transcription elongation factor Elf1